MHTNSVHIVIGEMRREHNQELFHNVQDAQYLRFQKRKKSYLIRVFCINADNSIREEILIIRGMK